MAQQDPWKSKEYIGLVPKLVACLPVKEVIEGVRSKGMITAAQEEDISSNRLSRDMTRALLKQLAKGTAESFEKFIAVLCDTDVVSKDNDIHKEALPTLRSLIPSPPVLQQQEPSPLQQHESSAANGSNGASASVSSTAPQTDGAGSANAEPSTKEGFSKQLRAVLDREDLAEKIGTHLSHENAGKFARKLAIAINPDYAGNYPNLIEAYIRDHPNTGKPEIKNVRGVLDWAANEPSHPNLRMVFEALRDADRANEGHYDQLVRSYF